MTQDAFTSVGRVVKTHGLTGEVSVAPATEASLALLEGAEVWFVPPSMGVRTARIVSVRPGPKGPIVGFDAVRDIDAARGICGADVLVATAALPAAWVESFDEEAPDIAGYAVYDETRGFIGDITDTLVTGANDVWEIDGPFGEVLVPVIDDVVLEIDDDAREVRVRLLVGLLPEEGEDA